MLLSLFLLGTWPFWILFAVSSIIMLALIENEKPFWATGTVVAVFLALHYLGDFNLIAFAMSNLLKFAAFCVGYLIVGTGYAIFRWWRFVRDRRHKYDDIKTTFLEEKGVTGNLVPPHLVKEWKQRVSEFSEGRYDENPFSGGITPKARNYKGRIMLWLAYWPWSVLWYLIDDPIKRLFREIYNQIAGLLQRIANKAFAGTEQDFQEPPPASDPPASSDPKDDGQQGNTRVFNEKSLRKGEINTIT